jgi:hypothetical protein
MSIGWENVAIALCPRVRISTRRIIPKGLLPGICLVDVVSDERRYVYRLVGTADVEVRSQDPTDKSVMEGFFGPSLDDVFANYDRVVLSRAPHIDPQHFVATSGRYVTEETIFRPLSDDEEIVLVFSLNLAIWDRRRVRRLTGII